MLGFLILVLLLDVTTIVIFYPKNLYTLFYKGNFFHNLVFSAYKVDYFELNIVKPLHYLMLFSLIACFVLKLDR